MGAVFRGCLWLDGAMCGRGESLENAITETFGKSPHAGQVRVILLSRANLPEDAEISLEDLSTKAKKPVIMLGEGELTLKVGGERVKFSAAGLGRWSAEGVLKTATREGTIPEALRVAGVILSGLPTAEDA